MVKNIIGYHLARSFNEKFIVKVRAFNALIPMKKDHVNFHTVIL